MFEDENHLNSFFSDNSNNENHSFDKKSEDKPIESMDLNEVNHRLSEIESRHLMGKMTDSEFEEKERLLVRKGELE
jgi:hypothetical protein